MRDRRQKPNILFIILDTVRASNTSLHGYHRSTTPFISSFAKDATVYYQARAPSVASLPSHVSMFTGYHTEEHQLGNGDHEDYRIAPGSTVWESVERDHGYRTGVFSTNPYLTMSPVGLKDAFDHAVRSSPWPFPTAVNPREYWNADDTKYGKFLQDSVRSSMPVRSLTNGAAMYLDKAWSRWPITTVRERFYLAPLVNSFLEWSDQDGPWAACVNLMDAHEPYEPLSKFDRWSEPGDWEAQSNIDHPRWDFMSGSRPWSDLNRVRNLYDGAIRQVDSKVELLIDALEQRNELDDTLVVVTSDHGQAFGEYSCILDGQRLASHTVGIHEALLHVPLVVKEPGQEDGEVVHDPVSLTNLSGAIERVVGGDPFEPAINDDRVLATQLALNRANVEDAVSRGVSRTAVSDRLRAVYTTDRKGPVRKRIASSDRAVEFDLNGGADPDIVECDPGEVNEFFEDMEDVGIKQTRTDKGEIDRETQERLSTLGYLS